MIPAWTRRSACRGADTELFAQADEVELIAVGRKADRIERVKDALSYCDRCPVTKACGDDAANSTDYPIVGVRGGEYITFKVADKRLLAARKHAKGKEVAVSETVDKEAYLLELATLVKRFVIAVHNDPAKAGKALEAARALQGPANSVDAVDWMLAAMVNPKRSLEELLGWTAKLTTEPDRLNTAETQAA